MKEVDYVIGVDEAGRGPLAGPVAVGVVLVANDFDWELLPKVRDSKKLSPKNREAIFGRVEQLKQSGCLDYCVTLVPAKIIDEIGIVPSINQALQNSLYEILSQNRQVKHNAVRVKLDGGLKAPIEFIFQETIIKGDDKELVIGLASIMAKVTRDKYMDEIAQNVDFLAYNFAKHKGYGTKAHRSAILENGLSVEHRTTFCQNCVQQKV